MEKTVRIKALYPNFYGDNLIAYVSLRIILFFNDARVRADIMGLSSDASVDVFKKKIKRSDASGALSSRAFRVYRDAIPPGPLWGIARRLCPLANLHRFSEARYTASLRHGDIAYLWPGASVELYRELKAKGYIIVTERINTLLSTSRRILDEEYIRLGLPPSHGLSAREAEEERECMELADYIFSPSPGVSASILDAGIAASKILATSYGLRDSELLPPRPEQAKEKVTAIFVGSICVRKGIHLLFDAWEKAGVDARLIIVGRISPEVENLVKARLARRPDISHVDFVDDLVPIYREADFLVLPSLEEGSPLVSYLALGAAIPLIVSPMGAGGIVEDGTDGLIVEPHDIIGLAGAIRTMVLDAELRQRMGAAAGAKAPAYTWQRVALSRRELLFAAMVRDGAMALAPEARR